jgi:hypothetical protein
MLLENFQRKDSRKKIKKEAVETTKSRSAGQ